jgi:transposase
LIPPPRASEGSQRRREPDAERLLREIERLQRENGALREKAERAAEKVAERDREIAEKDKQIADLERQLATRKQNSRNSSKPPSSDGLAGESRVRGWHPGAKRSRKKPGGQPGHPGHHRPQVPAERVNEAHPVYPEQCAHCGHAFGQNEQPGSCDVHRHQVVEIPVVAAHIIEYQCHRLVCPQCHQGTRAPVPEQAKRQTGPQLTALVAYLTVTCRMPRRVLETVLEQVLGTAVSVGNLQTCWEEASEAVEEPCQQLERQLPREPVLNVDETGWRTNGEKRYLWAFVAAGFVLYTIARTRGSELLIRLLGAVFEGILCSDRFSGYLKYHRGQAQFCWAHLKRNILGVLDFTKLTATERFCRDALAVHASLFRLWHKFRSGLIDRPELLCRSIRIQRRLLVLAEANLDNPDRQVQNLALALFEHGERLFAFLEHAGVEPTNNSAERALRTGVQWRKICFGNRSATGERATARLLTVTQTCRLQGRSPLPYLASAVANHRARQAPPSLIPSGR